MIYKQDLALNYHGLIAIKPNNQTEQSLSLNESSFSHFPVHLFSINVIPNK